MTWAARPSELVRRPVTAMMGISSAASDGSSRTHFLSLAALGQYEYYVGAMDSSEIAVDRLAGMEKVTSRSGRGERGGDLLTDQAPPCRCP